MAGRRELVPVLVVVQAALALVGGYWVTVGLSSVMAHALTFVFGRVEAVVLTGMLAFGIYLLLILWGFAVRGVVRLSLGLGFVGGIGWTLPFVIRLTGAD